MDSKGCYALETIRTVVLIVYSCPGLGEIESGWSRSKILKLYWLSNRLDQKRKKKKKEVNMLAEKSFLYKIISYSDLPDVYFKSLYNIPIP